MCDDVTLDLFVRQKGMGEAQSREDWGEEGRDTKDSRDWRRDRRGEREGNWSSFDLTASHSRLGRTDSASEWKEVCVSV